MNILEQIWVSVFTKDTYSCIKGRGIHGAMRNVKRAIKDRENARYCLKIDIRKFYPSIDHDVLKAIIRRKIKCKDTLALLDTIIDSTDGVPIGNYLSQYFANLMLAYFDHWIKEEKRVRYYFRLPRTGRTSTGAASISSGSCSTTTKRSCANPSSRISAAWPRV